MMAYRTPKFVHTYKDRHGKDRVYFNKAGRPKIALRGPVGSEAFWIDYHSAATGMTKATPAIGAERVLPGSLDDAVHRYFASPEYLGLAPSTQIVVRRQLDAFRQAKDRGQRPIKALERAHVKAILAGMADRKGAANSLLKRLKVLTRFAVEIDMLRTDPLAGMKGFKYDVASFHTWSLDDVAKFTDRHKPGSKAHLAMTLMLCTGQRRSDAVKMSWADVTQDASGYRIAIRQQKTKAVVTIPLHADLLAVIEPLPQDAKAFLMTAQGRPFTAAGFGNWMRDRCDEAGLPDCSSHGLRSAMAARLAEAGCSVKEIAAITGHTTLAQVALYTKAAEQKKLAASAMDALAKAEARTKSANPAPKVSKTGT